MLFFYCAISFAKTTPTFPFSTTINQLQRGFSSGSTKTTTNNNQLYDTKYFTQILDHFTFTPQSYQTFQQRYLINGTYWGGAKNRSPIFVYMGGEADVELFAHNTGFMFDYAPHFNALLVFIEHRFYGKSIPFEGKKEARSSSNITHGYLSSTQALADYATLIINLKNNLTATDSPVVVFGGSYGGMLAAWFRLKYPHLSIGALASSAPILYFDNITSPYAYNDIITQDLNYIGVDILEQWLNTAYSYTAMTDYPTASNFLNPLPPYPVKQMCKAIDDPRHGSNTLEKLYAAVNIFYNYSGEVNCFDLINPPDPYGLSGWTWQPRNGTTTKRPSFAKTSSTSTPGPTGLLRNSVAMVLKNISNSLVAIIAKEGAHHVDLRSSSSEDPEWLKDVRREEYFHSSRLQQAALAHCTLHSPVSSGQWTAVNEAMKGLEFSNLDPVIKDSESKLSIDSDDLKLAVQSKVNFSFAPPPPREQDTLISPNYQLAIPKKRTAQHVEETEEEEEGSDPNPASNQNQNLSQDRTDLPQEAPQRVSFPLGAKRPR
nr:lysosomal Pro-X carboxypeptidase-like [Ipomoea batatas]